MSEQVEQRLLELLEHPTHSPYGNPIPGLGGVDEGSPASTFTAGVVSVVDLVQGAGAPVEGVIRRLGEPVQYEPELLRQLQGAGLVPGASSTFVAGGDFVSATATGAGGEGLELPVEVAQHIYVGTAGFTS